MKREIKFRGRNNGVWEYGNLIIADNGSPYIFPPEICETDGHHLRQGDDAPHWVDPATVGQYTGLKDRNGREIYEGDIVRNLRHNTEEICYFHSKFACFCFQERIGYDEIHYYQKCDEKVLEVIGNIYEDQAKLIQIEQDLLAEFSLYTS